LILIVGGGNFGVKALQHLSKIDRVLVVDPNGNCLAKDYVEYVVRDLEEFLVTERHGTALLIADGAEILAKLLEKRITLRYVVPAAPMHVAYEALKNFLKWRGFDVKPFHGTTSIARELEVLGVEVRSASSYGMLVASYMPFNMKCRLPCSEPSVCPVTGKVKPAQLYNALNSTLNKYFRKSLVLRSILLAECVGGYDPKPLQDFATELSNEITNGDVVAIATACSCHGIVNIFAYENL